MYVSLGSHILPRTPRGTGVAAADDAAVIAECSLSPRGGSAPGSIPRWFVTSSLSNNLERPARPGVSQGALSPHSGTPRSSQGARVCAGRPCLLHVLASPGSENLAHPGVYQGGAVSPQRRPQEFPRGLRVPSGRACSYSQGSPSPLRGGDAGFCSPSPLRGADVVLAPGCNPAPEKMPCSHRLLQPVDAGFRSPSPLRSADAVLAPATRTASCPAAPGEEEEEEEEEGQEEGLFIADRRRRNKGQGASCWAACLSTRTLATACRRKRWRLLVDANAGDCLAGSTLLPGCWPH